MSLAEQVQLKWKRFQYVETLMLSMSISFLTLSIFYLFDVFSDLTLLFIILFLLIIIFFVISKVKNISSLHEKDVFSFLNREFRQLEFSAHLIEKDDIVLSELARYQKKRLINHLPDIGEIKVPNSLKNIGFYFVFALVLSSTLISYKDSLVSYLKPVYQQNEKALNTIVRKNEVVRLIEAKIIVESPPYTKIQKFEQTDLNIAAVESALLQFRLQFSTELKKAYLLINQRDTIILKRLESVVKTDYRLSQSGFYSIHWETKAGTYSSDYYQFTMIKDQAPEVDIIGLKSYTTIQYDQNLNLSFDVLLNDDYGISGASLIATLSKGGGESVKFREQEFRLKQTFNDQLRSYKVKQEINLKQLEMEPGDELFLFVKAFDNKTSLAQESRTLTHIIAMPDTNRIRIAVSTGLPVNRMPDYFRSQRQIIIDTEALIKQRLKIKNDRFMEISNNIGIDQKLLRLRYGKFFGEEFESQEFGIASFDPEQNDTNDEHSDEDPEQVITDPETAMEIIADFIHDHDAEDQDAFIEASVRVLMKQALSYMWDAELHLRMGKPEKALPFEYQALELIKEATKKSRIYVERVGFEPPLLKPIENRYKGELNKITNLSKKTDVEETDQYQSIQKLIKSLQSKMTITPTLRVLLKKAGDELASLIDGVPILGLNALRTIKKVSESDRIDEQVSQSLKIILLELLPDRKEEIQKNRSVISKLQQQYLMELQKLQ